MVHSFNAVSVAVARIIYSYTTVLEPLCKQSFGIDCDDETFCVEISRIFPKKYLERHKERGPKGRKSRCKNESGGAVLQ